MFLFKAEECGVSSGEERGAAKRQYVRTPFIPDWEQVPLETLNHQAELGLRLEGPGQSNTVALTFDDGPGFYTRDILRVLAGNRVKATFFMQGEKVEKNPALAKEVLRAGHSLGNHTYSHPRADRRRDFNLLVEQVDRTERVFRRVLKQGSKLFRPAYGAITDNQLVSLKRLGYHAFAWSVDSQDWYLKNAKKIYSMVVENLHPEAIILMHDGGGGNADTVRSLQMIIDECKRRRYRFCTLDSYVVNS